MSDEISDLDDRLRRIRVSDVDVFHGLTKRRKDGEKIYFGRLPIPDDVKVVAVHYDPSCRGFWYTVRHPSFSPVEPGHYIPELEDWNTVFYTAYRIATPEADAAREKLTAERIAAALRRLGVASVKDKSGDPYRWSVTDLATDLAHELAEDIADVPVLLGAKP